MAVAVDDGRPLRRTQASSRRWSRSCPASTRPTRASSRCLTRSRKRGRRRPRTAAACAGEGRLQATRPAWHPRSPPSPYRPSPPLFQLGGRAACLPRVHASRLPETHCWHARTRRLLVACFLLGALVLAQRLTQSGRHWPPPIVVWQHHSPNICGAAVAFGPLAQPSVVRPLLLLRLSGRPLRLACVRTPDLTAHVRPFFPRARPRQASGLPLMS